MENCQFVGLLAEDSNVTADIFKAIGNIMMIDATLP
jgi:hypothetical protein